MLKSERRQAKQRKNSEMKVSGRSVKSMLAQQNSGCAALAAKRKQARRSRKNRRKRG